LKVWPRRVRLLTSTALLASVLAVHAGVALFDASNAKADATARQLVVVPNKPFNLRAVDNCFDAPVLGGPTTWPFKSISTRHPLRSDLNDPRLLAHMGNDIWAPRDKAPVYAMQSGVLHGIRKDRFYIGGYVHSFFYFHVTLRDSLHNLSVIRRGELLGDVFSNYWHVHISELIRWKQYDCGLVNPSRPTGPFYNPANDEAPVIKAVNAYVANDAAYPTITTTLLSQDPLTTTDPSTPLSLDSLHGVVDFRASVTNRPKNLPPINPASGVRFPEHAQTPAAIRAWIAPATDRGSHIGRLFRFDGAHFMIDRVVQRDWAFGTWRHDACYYGWKDPANTCGQDVVWHLAGYGYDTRNLRNGPYEFCVQALTTDDVRARRCAGINVRN
jgi:hypothetical protein